MIRLFDRHQFRKQKELSGLWDFSPIDNKEEQPEDYNYQLNVPGCWENHPDFLTYRGLGVYRKNISLSEKTNLRLLFKGVSHTADVYFDGKKVAHHYNAYTPFDCILKDVEKGEHELKVLVDNSFSKESALHTPNDYYTYGGLIRSAAVEEINDAYIKRIEFIPYQENEKWKAKVALVLENLTENSLKINIETLLGDKYNLDFKQAEIAANSQLKIEKEFAFPEAKSWSAENPTLYLLKAKLYLAADESDPKSNVKGKLIDDLIDRVGFREIKVDGTRLLLNGKEIRLLGFNRHEDHPMVGSAIPFSLMKKDLDLIEDLESNTVRTSHYPNDELFLDLCDERGIFVWEENHARGFSLEQMLNPNFDQQCADCNREMVQNHINHPAIVVWGILNECASAAKEGREIYKKQFEQIKKMDQSRPLTFATREHFKDICLDLVDIVSLNIYSGWYDWFSDDPAEYYQREKKWIDKNGGADKPIIISEFGAGAIYNFREPSRVKWTEERQQDLLDELLSYYLDQDEIVGTLIWQFADCRVSEDGIPGEPGTAGNAWFHTRPRSKNNKGIVDEYRRPKLAYQTVKRIFKDEK
ncbi:glycoside hydrolase family 2 protein [Halanaerobium saccharolyticum]|uniref:glycoside hydrolase family 2 protein n=1 Tax=Halanaerobium saccharolyticum TaxID=43595 RepID=UPI003FCCAC72